MDVGSVVGLLFVGEACDGILVVGVVVVDRVWDYLMYVM